MWVHNASAGRNVRAGKERVPLSLDIVLSAVAAFYNAIVLPRTLERTMAVGMVLGYFATMRVSNYIVMPKSKDHCVKAANVEFEFTTLDGEAAMVRASDLLAMERPGVVDQLTSAVLVMDSSKGDRRREGRNCTIPARGLEGEEVFNAVHFLHRWVEHAQYSSTEDPFLSQEDEPGERRAPSYAQMQEFVKMHGVKFGLPAAVVGTHSLRIAAGTQMTAAKSR